MSKATTIQPDEVLTEKLLQLQAMLTMTYGNARDAFTAMSDTLQDNFLWACNGLIDECVELNERCADSHGAQGVKS